MELSNIHFSNVLFWAQCISLPCFCKKKKKREYNAGIPGMPISTSCVFNPSLGRTSCLMKQRDAGPTES